MHPKTCTSQIYFDAIISQFSYRQCNQPSTILRQLRARVSFQKVRAEREAIRHVERRHRTHEIKHIILCSRTQANNSRETTKEYELYDMSERVALHKYHNGAVTGCHWRNVNCDNWRATVNSINTLNALPGT